jgi:hypothetical protein
VRVTRVGKRLGPPFDHPVVACRPILMTAPGSRALCDAHLGTHDADRQQHHGGKKEPLHVSQAFLRRHTARDVDLDRSPALYPS